MKRILSLLLVAGLAAVIFTAVNSCTPRASLKTERAYPSEITGTYTLFLYGARHIEDIETIAILAREGTPYTFEIYSPEFNYKVVKGVPADSAFTRAAAFVSFHHAFDHYEVSRILDGTGAVIGYEVRPFYRPFEYGYSNVLDVWYTLRDGKVITTIHLKPEVERLLRDGDERTPFLFQRR